MPVSLPSVSWKTYFHTRSCFFDADRFDALVSDSGDLCHGVVDPDHAHGAAGAVGVLDDVQVPVLSQLPYGLDGTEAAGYATTSPPLTDLPIRPPTTHRLERLDPTHRP